MSFVRLRRTDVDLYARYDQQTQIDVTLNVNPPLPWEATVRNELQGFPMTFDLDRLTVICGVGQEVETVSRIDMAIQNANDVFVQRMPDDQRQQLLADEDVKRRQHLLDRRVKAQIQPAPAAF